MKSDSLFYDLIEMREADTLLAPVIFALTAKDHAKWKTINSRLKKINKRLKISVFGRKTILQLLDQLELFVQAVEVGTKVPLEVKYEPIGFENLNLLVQELEAWKISEAIKTAEAKAAANARRAIEKQEALETENALKRSRMLQKSSLPLGTMPVCFKTD